MNKKYDCATIIFVVQITKMKYIKQFLIIIAFSFAGEILHFLIPLPIPSSIYGIILLFLSLCTGILKVEHIKETSNFLVEIMPLMFIPSAVGLLESWEVLSSVWLSYISITIITTFLVMIISGRITQTIIRWRNKGAKNE